MSGGFQIQFFSTANGAGVGWRMLSGNNREAGRGVDRYADDVMCRHAVSLLQERPTLLVPTVRRASSRLWTWELRADGRVVAAASHRFERMIRCEQSAMQFVINFAAADLGSVLVDASSRR